MLTRLKWAYALLGGALAWFAHLFLTAAIGESVCTLDGTLFTLFTYPASVWILLGLSILCFSISIGATIVSFALRSKWTYGAGSPAPGVTFIGTAGLLSNGLFAFVILAQTVPVFVLLNGC